jgi:hypothetical protein
MIVNLYEFKEDQGLEGNWWLHLRIADFTFFDKIPSKEMAELIVENGDILIHKHVPEGERFPQIRYYLMQDERLWLQDGKVIREHLAERMLVYIKEHKKYPFAAEFEKHFQNDSVQIKYHPTSFDNFSLKLTKEMMETAEITPAELEKLPAETENPIAGKDLNFSIKRIDNAAVLEQISAEDPKGKNTVCVFDAEVLEINKRESTFQEHVNIYYLIRIKGGTAAADTKKSSLRRPFELANIKISDNLMEKTPIAIGDKISFNSKFKKDKQNGVVLQNILKIEKE